MRATPIDPRDQTVEVDDPAYRVIFWTADGGTSDEWELTEADLDEVLAWIPAHAKGRLHSLWAVIRTQRDVTMVRLRGVDLDTSPSSYPRWAERV